MLKFGERMQYGFCNIRKLGQTHGIFRRRFCEVFSKNLIPRSIFVFGIGPMLI